MIRDLSETLHAILDDKNLEKSFPELAEAQVAFDRPSEQFKPSQTTIDVFLFDIRENLELRSNEPVVERRDGQAFIIRPPKRIDCSYLVTAWAAGGTGPNLVLLEHELLGQVMQLFSRYPTIPENFLQGDLKKQGVPPPLFVNANVNIKDPADFWTALGNKLRPSLVVTVTVEMQTAEAKGFGVVKSHELRLDLLTPAAESEPEPSSEEKSEEKSEPKLLTVEKPTADKKSAAVMKSATVKKAAGVKKRTAAKKSAAGKKKAAAKKSAAKK